MSGLNLRKTEDRMESLKKEVLQAAKDSFTLGLVAGTSGNISAYDCEEQIMIITPTSVPYDTMEISDLVTMKLDGTTIESKHNPSSEWRMHAKIYQERSDVKSVLHTHSPYATAYAVCQDEIPVILIEMVPFIGGSVPVAKFAMPGSVDVATESLKVLGDRKACLLSNHGTLSIGSSVHGTLTTAIYLEDAAKIYHLAQNAGTVKILSENEINLMKNGHTV